MYKQLEQIQQDLHSLQTTLGATLPEYLNTKNVAAFTGLSKHTIYKYVEHNQIPFFKFGNSLRFKRMEIVQWMESGGAAAY